LALPVEAHRSMVGVLQETFVFSRLIAPLLTSFFGKNKIVVFWNLSGVFG